MTTIEYMLLAREHFVKYYKRFEIFLMPFFKFLLGYVVFAGILSVGRMHEAVATLADGFAGAMLTAALALMFTVMPMNVSWLLIILTLTAHFSAQLEVAAALFIFLMFVFLFYARMAPKESVFILVMFVAFRLNLPYLVPLLAGLYFPLSAAVPIAVGVFLHSLVPLLFGLMEPREPPADSGIAGTAGTEAAAGTEAGIGAGIEAGAGTEAAEPGLVDMLTALPAAFSDVYSALLAGISDAGAWLFTAVIFAMVVVLVFFVSRQSFDYAKQIAIGLGSAMTIFGFIINAIFGTPHIGLGFVILGTILSAGLALLVSFVDQVLDYSKAETVQFEDEDYFYHVRVVPKITVKKDREHDNEVEDD